MQMQREGNSFKAGIYIETILTSPRVEYQKGRHFGAVHAFCNMHCLDIHENMYNTVTCLFSQIRGHVHIM